MKTKAFNFFSITSIIVFVLNSCSTAPATNTQLPPASISTSSPIPTSTPTFTPIPPPPASFPSPLGDRAIFTYYFYWYDVISKSHTDYLTNTPVDYQTMSWRDVSWHKKQLDEITYSGIDVILPIFWYDQWSNEWSHPGLENLALALEQTRLEGKTPPAVGAFLDTTSSTDIDLRLQVEQEYLYENIHYFFTAIPRSYWALAENDRPIIWSYTANWPSAYDQSFIDYIYNQFESDFGVRPFIVLDFSWDYPTQTINGQRVKDIHAGHLNYDATYSWGGAIAPNSSSRITSIGPGVDDHTVPDRIPPTIVDRKNGVTYKNGFSQAILCGTPWLAIETWNEYHESTEIAESIEYDRQYIETTREFNQYFKDGRLPDGIRFVTDYTDSHKISAELGESNREEGLALAPSGGDGQHTSVVVGNVSVRQTVPMIPNVEASYLYFYVDNGFYFNAPEKITITVTFFDDGNEPIYLQYDSAKCGSPFDVSKMYKEVSFARRHNTQSWKTASVQISDATFSGNQNFGADFRLVTFYSPLTISEIRIEKIQ